MIRHYKEGDLSKINLQDEQLKEGQSEWYMFKHPDTIVFEDGDKVLAIIRPCYEAGGRLFLGALISKDCGYKSISMFKKIKSIIDDWLYFGDVQRIEFTTQSNFKQANRLAELLGFQKEGTLRRYYNGMDFNIWGRIE